MGSDENLSIYGAKKYIKLMAFISLEPLVERIVQIALSITRLQFSVAFLRIYIIIILLGLTIFIGGYIYSIYQLNKFVNSGTIIFLCLLDLILLILYTSAEYWTYQIIFNSSYYNTSLNSIILLY